MGLEGSHNLELPVSLKYIFPKISMDRKLWMDRKLV